MMMMTSKGNSVVNDGNCPVLRWAEPCNNSVSVKRPLTATTTAAVLDYTNYRFSRGIAAGSTNRSVPELAGTYTSSARKKGKHEEVHSGLEEQVDEDEDEDEDKSTDTSPILACAHSVTASSRRPFHSRNLSKAKKKFSKSCRSWSESKTRYDDFLPRSSCKDTTISASDYCLANSEQFDKCKTNCFRYYSNPLPPQTSPHASNYNNKTFNLQCCLEEPNSFIPTEVFAADVCFIKNSLIHSHGRPQNLNLGPPASNKQQNSSRYNRGVPTNLPIPSKTSALLVNTSNLLPARSTLFSPVTEKSASSVVTAPSQNFADGSEGGSPGGIINETDPLPSSRGRQSPVTTNACSLTSSSSTSEAVCTTTCSSSSSLPAWSTNHKMDKHCHPPQTSKPQVDKLARRQLIAVSVLCFSFMVCEIVGGVLSNSLALFTDVIHLGCDLISFFISLTALFLSTKPATISMSFGYHRIEVLGAVISVLLIWLTTGILCYIASESIISESYKNVHEDEMLVTASLGVMFNVIIGFILHSDFCCKSGVVKHHGHSHSHIHNSNSGANSQKTYQRLSQEPTENTPAMMECQSLDKPQKNINIRAAIIHVVGDIIQSTGVLVAALIIKFTDLDKYKLADPICTYIFSIIVLCTTFNVLRDTLYVIIEGVPRDINYKKLRSDLENLEHVKMVHNLCVWSLTFNKNAITVHLAKDEVAESHVILEKATAMLRQHYSFYHITIQVEQYIPSMSQCPECLS